MTTIAPPTPSGSAADSIPAPAIPTVPLSQALRAVVAKEMRQSLIWVALVFTIEVLLYFVCEWNASGSIFDGNNYRNILLANATSAATVCGCIIAGLLLGIFQPRGDSNFDLWAFLVHRPVSRSVLFAGRAIAGLILYFLASGVPILILLVVAATPLGGRFFIWQDTLPTIINFLAGIPFYFAGLLIAERGAAVYGSRLLPVVIAVAASVWTIGAYWFWLAVLGIFLATLMLVVADEGSAISHGYTLTAPRRNRIALALSLLLSFSLLLVPGGEIARARLFYKQGEYTYDDLSKTESIGRHARRAHVLLPDGTLALVTHVWDHTPKVDNDISTTYTDVEGHPIAAPSDHEMEELRNNGAAVPSSDGSVRPSFWDIDNLVRQFDSESSEKTHIFHWYAVQPRGIFYVYDEILPSAQSRSHTTFVGTVGPNGFAKPGEATPRFPDGFAPNIPIVRTDRALYRVDMSTYRVTTVLTTRPDEKILAWHYAHTPHETTYDIDTANIRVLTSRRLIEIKDNGTIVGQFPITHDISHYEIRVTEWNDASASLGHPKWAVRYYSRWTDYKISYNPTDTWEFYDAEGKLISTHSFPNTMEWLQPDTQPSMDSPLSAKAARKVHRSQVKEGLVTAAANPLLILLGDITLRPLFLSTASPNTQTDLPAPLWDVFGRPWVAGTLTATLLLCATVGWGTAGLYRLRKRWWWAALAFVCGPAALLLLVSVNRWPRRERCPLCRAWRPLNEDTCPRCAAGWPHHTPTGTEIFA